MESSSPVTPASDAAGPGDIVETDGERRAREAVEALGLPHEIRRHGRVSSLAEAAAARGVAPGSLIKTMVVRRGEDDYLLVLVPGDRTISWPKLRELLGVKRLSMPDAATAKEATGYERGTITPLGPARAWPVIADSRVVGPISIGGGGHGVGISLDGEALAAALGATRADVTDAE